MTTDEKTEKTAKRAVCEQLRRRRPTLDFGAETLMACTTASMDRPQFACTGFKANHPLVKNVNDNGLSQAIPSLPVA